MLKLAALINNPGEPPAESRYNDPAGLQALGYTDRVFYETTALSGLESADVIESPELRRWVQHIDDHLSEQIEQARRAGLGVYLFYDMLVLPANLVEQQGAAFTCRRQPRTLCPASDRAIQQATVGLDALLSHWPGVAGVVLRIGDNDAQRLPHLTGNDVYSPYCSRCSKLTAADRIIRVLEAAYERVVNRHDKRLIARAWHVRPGGWHDDQTLGREVAERLPGEAGDDRLMLSFKFTHTDFWRYQKWNPPSLACGGRPIIYELQCQREYEGKGGVPNWQVPLWRDGHPEMPPTEPRPTESRKGADAEANRDQPAGLAEAAKQVNLAGLWAWVRGGGWGGPFVSDETWIDANVWAVPRLAEQPEADAAALGETWVSERLGISDPRVAEAIMAVLTNSPETVRQAFYIEPWARSQNSPWHPNGDWIRDDLLDAAAAQRMVQRLPNEQLESILTEKEAAAERISADRARLQQRVADRQHRALEPLVNTLSYTESLTLTLRDLLAGLVAYRRYKSGQTDAAAGIAKQKLLAAQSHWNHHLQRDGALPGTATAFRESQLWDLTQQILTELSE